MWNSDDPTGEMSRLTDEINALQSQIAAKRAEYRHYEGIIQDGHRKEMDKHLKLLNEARHYNYFGRV